MSKRLRHDSSTLMTVGVVAVALFIAWLLYPSPKTHDADAAVTEIVYWTPPGLPNDAAKIMVEEFERRNPQYRVLLGTATVRDATGDPTRLLLGVAGEVPPDVILFDRFAIVEWASRGAFTDLNPYIEASTNTKFPVVEENYFPPAWTESIYQGKNYAIAMDADTRALFYNLNSFARAGLVYRADDPDVIAGRARAGEARPPKSWEEIFTKKLHADGAVASDGLVTLSGHTRRPFINEEVDQNQAVDLRASGVRAGDVVAVVKGTALYRARVAEVISANQLRLDLTRELPSNARRVPGEFASGAEIKIYDQDGYAIRLSRFDPETGIMTQAGFIPLLGNSWLYLFAWQNGGEFMNAEGTRVTMDDPNIIEATQWLVDVYDAMGGIEMVNYIQSNQKRGGTVSGVLDPFISERIAMRVDIDYHLRDIMRLRPDLQFGVVPMPLPEKQIAKGITPFGWGGGWAYAIPSTSQNKDAAWYLIQWLTSFEANRILAEYEASLFRSRGEKFVPRLHADKRVLQWQIETFVDNSTELPPNIITAYHTFADLMPTSRFRPVTPVGQKLWTENAFAADIAINHVKTPYLALTDGQRQVQSALNDLLHPPQGPLVNWNILIALYTAGVFALFGGLYWKQERKRRIYGGARRAWMDGYIAASPWLIGFIVFGAGPILFSIVISFCSYDVINPARFVGMHNYNNLMGWHYDEIAQRNVSNDPSFYTSLWNTLYMVISVPLHIIIGLLIAVLLDAKVRGLTVYRSIYYLPAIVPPVAAFILWIWLFDPGRGMINNMLIDLGMQNPPKWLDDSVWAKPSLILMSLWGVGASMIIWLAGLKDIPESYYEAAAVDGANWLQRFTRITLPLLTPYILFNLIIGLIGVFQIFEAAYIMTDGGPAKATFFFAYKLFFEAFRYLNMGAASAMAWILFVVVLAVTLFQLWFSRKWVHYGA